LGFVVSARWLSFYAGRVQAFAGNQPGVKFEKFLADEGHVVCKYVFWSLGKRARLNFFLCVTIKKFKLSYCGV